MTYYTTNLDEEFFRVEKWKASEADEPFSELHEQLREFERLTKQAKLTQSKAPVNSAGDASRFTRSHFLFVSSAAFVSSGAFLVQLVTKSPNSVEYPLTYIVAFFISFATAVALLAESKALGTSKKAK